MINKIDISVGIITKRNEKEDSNYCKHGMKEETQVLM